MPMGFSKNLKYSYTYDQNIDSMMISETHYTEKHYLGIPQITVKTW
jgi:hypothetical protein